MHVIRSDKGPEAGSFPLGGEFANRAHSLG
jgi:hypothetical protein